jgi:serine/threonine-protein kinase HipA
MKTKCLYCYEPLEKSDDDFHERCSKSFFGGPRAPALPYTIKEMAELAKTVVERSVAVPGVQAKLSLSLVRHKLGDGAAGRLTVVGALGGGFILKPPSDHYPEMPQNEHVTMRIAEAFGIRTVPSSLIRLASGELSYVTRRIDRTGEGTKIHMLDMFQILEAFDKYKSSIERVGKALREYSTNTLLDTLYFFELCVFCFLTGNNDMHLKNFSMIKSGADWILAPAYDLLNVHILNPEDKEELALTLEGKKRKLNREHFDRLGAGLGLNAKQVHGTFKRAITNKPIAEGWIKKSFLSTEYQNKYLALMDERYDVLNA